MSDPADEEDVYLSPKQSSSNVYNTEKDCHHLDEDYLTREYRKVKATYPKECKQCDGDQSTKKSGPDSHHYQLIKNADPEVISR